MLPQEMHDQIEACYDERDFEYFYKIDLFGREEDCWEEYKYIQQENTNEDYITHQTPADSQRNSREL